jgi:hypothetical protein
MFVETAKGSTEVVVNGKKSLYSWDGELTSAPHGFNMRADANFNGKKAHLNLKNKSKDELQQALVKYYANFRTQAQNPRKRSRRTKKHLNRRSRR